MYFKDRYDAGKHLATALKSYAGEDVLVLALPRGGIPVGFEIAQALKAPLDVLVVRKLGVPYHEELAMGALGPNDGIVLNQALIRQLGITEEQINTVLEKESRELNRRLKAFRGERPFPELSQKTVILVDDGLATGATAMAAVETLKRMQPKRLILAVPVCSPDAERMLTQHADRVICLVSPPEFGAVGSWYQDFRQTTDAEVHHLLEKAGQSRVAEVQS
jgi:putative phosphoribosyl transferase